MGFTPLEGIMMGTRSGSVDPGIVPYLCEHTGDSPDEVITQLNKKSGLLGVAGVSDMRDVLKAESEGDKDASLALNMFCYILAKHIAALCVAFGGEQVDALVFTAGIGENTPCIRRRTMERLGGLLHGARLGKHRNENNGHQTSGVVSLDDSKPAILVIETDEEAMICQDCLELV
jgi:acetate kinase